LPTEVGGSVSNAEIIFTAFIKKWRVFDPGPSAPTCPLPVLCHCPNEVCANEYRSLFFSSLKYFCSEM